MSEGTFSDTAADIKETIFAPTHGDPPQRAHDVYATSPQRRVEAKLYKRHVPAGVR